MIDIVKALKQEEEVLQNLSQFYIYEFSQYLSEIKLEQSGTYKPFNLERLWSNPNLHAFFIKYEDELIGFAIIESATETKPNNMEEFFIVTKYKGRGFGKMAATKLFQLFPGLWIITQVEKNYPAQAFWRSLINQITEGNYVERYSKSRKSIQEFHTDAIKISR